MLIEVCNLCNRKVSDFNKTEVIIKDHNGVEFDLGYIFRAKRRFKGVICDDCLELLRGSEKKEEPAND